MPKNILKIDFDPVTGLDISSDTTAGPAINTLSEEKALQLLESNRPAINTQLRRSPERIPFLLRTLDIIREEAHKALPEN